jgi:hypothetical protein
LIRKCAAGRSGTLGEFAIAYDEGKVIGVLQNTGGITQFLDEIIELVHKQTGAVVRYNSDPDLLMEDLEAVYRDRILPQHLKAMRGHDPDGMREV